MASNVGKKDKQLGFGSMGVGGFNYSVGIENHQPKPEPELPDLDSFEVIAVSVSGGKDSQACANIAFERFGGGAS